MTVKGKFMSENNGEFDFNKGFISDLRLFIGKNFITNSLEIYKKYKNIIIFGIISWFIASFSQQLIHLSMSSTRPH